MRIREPDPPARRLSDPQRTELRRRISAVPRDADRDHPSILGLIEYVESLDVPWWVSEGHGAVVLRMGDDLATGLDLLVELCDVQDWGADPLAGRPLDRT